MGYAEEQRAQARARQIREQQQVQRALQQGRAITGYSANPLEAMIQRIGSAFGIATPPRVTNDPSGSQRLMVAGGWAGQRSELPGTINVAGRTWTLSPQTRREGANAFYTPRGASTSTNTVASTSAPPPPILPPPQSSQPGRTSPTPSAGTGGSPAERAYQQEVSRVAQMAAQNPELQRYETARNIAKTQEEMNAVRDEGMRIWAAKHGGLAAKVKPGSSGYEAIQGVVGSSAPSALSNEQVLGVMSFDPNTVLTTTQNIQGQFRPNQQLTDQEILNAMSFDPNIALRSAANMAYAPMSSTEAEMLKAVGGEQGEYITPMNAIGAPGQEGLSFVTPAEQRRRDSSALFQALLNRANAQTR